MSLSTYRLPNDIDLAKPESIERLNKALIEIKNRLDGIEQVGVKEPPTPLQVTVQGRQGVLWMNWQRIVNVDGYVVVVSTDSAQTKIVSRTTLHDADTCTYQLPVGNVAQQYYFSVSAIRGKQISPRSQIINATSVAYGAGESAPPAPFNDPRDPHITIQTRLPQALA